METTVSEVKLYRKKGTVPMRPYVKGEDLSRVSISPTDKDAYPTDEDKVGGFIAHNADNPDDQWYVNKEYFEKNYEPA